MEEKRIFEEELEREIGSGNMIIKFIINIPVKYPLWVKKAEVETQRVRDCWNFVERIAWYWEKPDF